MSSSHSSTRDSMISGLFSGVISCVLLQPLDVIKTQVQLTNRSGISVVRDAIVRGQIRMLWTGVLPSLYRTAPGVSIYFTALDYLTRNSGNISWIEHILYGASARTVSVVTLIPFTVIKTRYESGRYQYRGVFQAIRHIYTHEGIQGLYRGTMATVLRDAPFSGIYLLFYKKIKSGIEASSTSDSIISRSVLNMSAGMVAGVSATVVTHPQDVIKTQLQVHQSKISMFQVLTKILQEQGITGMFKGMVPRIVRRPLTAAITWTVYENVMPLLAISTK